MIDKLDLEIPYGMPMRRHFARQWYNPRYDEAVKKSHDALYSVTADLRPLGIPARLSLDHKHHKRLGPKLEIIGAGELNYSDWIAIPRLVFEGDVEDAAILRADLTADIEDIPVSDFAGALWCARKLITRTEYGDALATEIQRQGSQTKYYGKKPNQFRIYNKTLHRKLELLPAHNRERRRRSEARQSFEEVFGYDPTKIITRAERQMGDREPEKRWGVRQLGNVYQLIDRDPFDRLQFKRDMKPARKITEPMTQIVIEALQERVKREGLDATFAYLREKFKPDAFRQFRHRYGEYLVESHEGLNREQLTARYRASLQKQLAA